MSNEAKNLHKLLCFTDALCGFAVRLVATFKEEQQKLKFVSSTQQLPDPNRYVIIKLKPLYDGDMDIYHINYRTACICERSFTDECKDLVWHTHFNFYEPFEWCYLDCDTVKSDSSSCDNSSSSSSWE